MPSLLLSAEIVLFLREEEEEVPPSSLLLRLEDDDSFDRSLKDDKDSLLFLSSAFLASSLLLVRTFSDCECEFFPPPLLSFLVDAAIWELDGTSAGLGGFFASVSSLDP